MVFPLPHILVIFSLHHDGHNFFLVFVVFFCWSLPLEQMGMMWMIWSRRLCTLYFSFLFIHLFLIISITQSPLTRRIRRPDKQLMLSNLPTPPPYISRLTSYSPLISFLCLDSVPTYLWEHDEQRFITVHHVCKLQAALFILFFPNPPRILLITFHYLRINIICLFSTNKIVVVVFLYYFPTNYRRRQKNKTKPK
jgi:hypothetical protein